MHAKCEICSFNRFGAISITKNLLGHVTLATLHF